MNPTMKRGMKTMIMFNKHLTQIEPLALPEGVNSKELTPHEIVGLHLQEQPKAMQEPQLASLSHYAS